jgi:lysophospholipase L1-like esterase
MKRFFSVVVPLAVAVAVVVPGSAHAATVNYVALGDSYSSGVGTDHYDLSSSCDRSSLAYPALVAHAKGYNLNDQACTGALTTDVINTQAAALDKTTTNLVTVTAGGNDAGFVNLLVSCTLTNCVSSINNTITWVNTQLAAKLDAMDSVIKADAPNAKVIVLGYPHLFSGTCLSAFGISSSEVSASNNLADAMDRVTSTEAGKFGFTYKSAISQFTNHGVCASKGWLHGLDLTSITSSYHPTTTGQSSGYEPLVLSAL